MNKFIKEAINPLSGLGVTKQRLGNISDNIKTSFRLLRRKQKPSQVEISLEQSELKVRYRNARITAISLLALLAWSFYILMASKNLQSIILSGLWSVGIAAYYLTICMDLYKARIALSNWNERAKISITFLDYLNAVAENPKNILPRKIKH
jgi:uncharacterized MnhB-related membrane protein